MKNLIILLMLSLSFVACAKKIIWNKPGGTHEEFYRDDSDCQFKAKQGTRPMGAFDNPMLWGLQTGQQESELYILCMRSKGYYQQQNN